MNKQLIKDLSQELVDKFELDKKQANSFVEKMFSVLQDGLQDEKIVKIKGLGTFKVISVQSRKSIDVNTGEPILIDGRDKISFTPDSDMRDYVNRPFAQFETVAINDGTDFSLIDKKFAEEEKEETSENSVENKQEDSNVNQQEDSIVNRQKDSISIEDQQQEDSVEDKQEETPENQPEEVQNSNVQSLATEVPNEVVGAPLQENILSEAPSSKEEETPAHDGPAAEEDNSAQEAPSMEENTPTQEAPSIVETANSQECEEPKDEESTKQEVLAQEPNESEQELEGNTPKAECVEQETKDSQPEIQAFDLEKKVQTATANISQKFEDENLILQAANEELRNNFRHQYRMMKGLITFFVVVVLLCLGGGYFLLNQLKKRDHRIEMLEILAYRNKNGINAQPGNDSTLATKTTAKQPSLSKQASKAQAKVKAEETVKTESKRTTDNNPSLSSGSTASGSNQSDNAQHNTMKSAAEANHAKLVPAETTESKQDKEQTAYNQDVRIRTGAYRIVGISHTVKVRSGQTLYSISRANLGPGMECYVQAVNGGKTNFKAGETVKIPKLQIKKKK